MALLYVFRAAFRNGPRDGLVALVRRARVPEYFDIDGCEGGTYVFADRDDGTYTYWWVPRERSPYS